MMESALSQKTCTPCRGGVPALSLQQAEQLRLQAPDWNILEQGHHIERRFTFKNFRDTLSFVNKVGELAEAEGHHPDIAFGWGYATITLYTHKIKGLHENDFIMAAKIDRLQRSNEAK